MTFDIQWKGRTGISTSPVADSACTPTIATSRASAYARMMVGVAHEEQVGQRAHETEAAALNDVAERRAGDRGRDVEGPRGFGHARMLAKRPGRVKDREPARRSIDLAWRRVLRCSDASHAPLARCSTAWWRLAHRMLEWPWRVRRPASRPPAPTAAPAPARVTLDGHQERAGRAGAGDRAARRRAQGAWMRSSRSSWPRSRR